MRTACIVLAIAEFITSLSGGFNFLLLCASRHPSLTASATSVVLNIAPVDRFSIIAAAISEENISSLFSSKISLRELVSTRLKY